MENLIPKTFEVEAVSLFGALKPEQLMQLWSYLEARQFSVGQRVFTQGELPSDIYIVVSGKIDFVIESDGVHQLECSFQSGDTFGETSFIGIQPQPGSTIVSGTDVAEVLVITRDALMRIHSESAELFGMLMMNLAREVSRKYHRKIGAF